MSYLRFDRTLMTNLEESLPREVLRTNKSGAYHCTTIVDCNTRRYHGLLVTPVPSLGVDNYVLLSSLDETVIQHGAEFNLGLHKFQGDNWSPNGHKYIREFDCETIPATIYRVGGVLLKKEKIFVRHESRILIRYTLLEAHSPTKLRLKPFLAFRSVRELTYYNTTLNTTYENIENGIKSNLYSGYPDLFMQLNKKNKFVSLPDWYRGIEYPKEQERGYAYKEDLYVPGFFEIDIKKGESVVFSAGLTSTDTRQLKREFDKEVRLSIPRDSFYNCLKNTAHQFYNKQENEHYLLAGYPWFSCRARDLFVALPGITLAIGEVEQFHLIMETAQQALIDFMEKGETELKIEELDQADVLLWAVWTIQQYSKYQGVNQCVERYGSLLKRLIEYLRQSKHRNLFLHDNGMLFTHGRDSVVSWMNATVEGKPVIPRSGYLVEVNALWYNALCFSSCLFNQADDGAYASVLEELAELVGDTFVALFRNDFGYLTDYIDEGHRDNSVRPNMVFAIALEFSPLSRPQQKQVLDVLTKELLTPKGLRTLSPKSLGYNPNYTGNQYERDLAYHQGTVWPWLMGFYLEAYLKLHRRSGISFVERHLIGFEEDITNHCISSLSELYDGNPPFQGRGGVSFAMNVAEILRLLDTLQKSKNQREEEQ